MSPSSRPNFSPSPSWDDFTDKLVPSDYGPFNVGLAVRVSPEKGRAGVAFNIASADAAGLQLDYDLADPCLRRGHFFEAVIPWSMTYDGLHCFGG